MGSQDGGWAHPGRNVYVWGRWDPFPDHRERPEACEYLCPPEGESTRTDPSLKFTIRTKSSTGCSRPPELMPEPCSPGMVGASGPSEEESQRGLLSSTGWRLPVLASKSLVYCYLHYGDTMHVPYNSPSKSVRFRGLQYIQLCNRHRDPIPEHSINQNKKPHPHQAVTPQYPRAPLSCPWMSPFRTFHTRGLTPHVASRVCFPP